jgi:hypothetical protein
MGQRTTDEAATAPGRTRRGGALVALVGLGMIVYAAAFIVRNFTHLIELGLGPEHVGATEEDIIAFAPGVRDYISHVQVNLGGFIASTGLAMALMGWYGIRRGATWAWWSVLGVTLTWVLIGGPIHFAYGFGTLAHLGPGYLAVALVGVGLYLSRPGR